MVDLLKQGSVIINRCFSQNLVISLSREQSEEFISMCISLCLQKSICAAEG